jgi:hypothetical protein
MLAVDVSRIRLRRLVPFRVLVAKQDEVRLILKEEADRTTRAIKSMSPLIAATALAGLIGGFH